MGGSASRPRNGLRKTEKYGSGVFIQLRSNSFYQKRLKKGNAPTVSGRFYHNSTRAAPRRLTAAHKTEKFSIPFKKRGLGGAKRKK